MARAFEPRPAYLADLLEAGSDTPAVQEAVRIWDEQRGNLESVYASKGLVGRFVQRVTINELDQVALGAINDARRDAIQADSLAQDNPNRAEAHSIR